MGKVRTLLHERVGPSMAIRISACALLCALHVLPARTEAAPIWPPTRPDISGCMIEPLELEAFLRSIERSQSQQVDIEAVDYPAITGPSSERKVEGVRATLDELVACTNAGSLLQLYALFTSDMHGLVSASEQELRAKPTPLPADERMTLRDLYEVHDMEDGRVGAIFAVDEPKIPSPVEPYYMFFEQAPSGRWLIDDLPITFSLEFEAG